MTAKRLRCEFQPDTHCSLAAWWASIYVYTLTHNVANNRQAGAVIELRNNGAQRNGRATQAPRRTVRVDWPCYVLMLKPPNVNYTFRQARPYLRTAPSGLVRLRILPSGRHWALHSLPRSGFQNDEQTGLFLHHLEWWIRSLCLHWTTSLYLYSWRIFLCKINTHWLSLFWCFHRII